MQTLAEVTAAHSRRLSELHQRRDALLHEAMRARDVALRAMPDLRKMFAVFDKACAAARDDRMSTEHKAAAARATAIARAVEGRDARLDAERTRRRDEDLNALDRKTRAEAEAERAFRDAVAGLTGTTTLEARQKTTIEAERRRQRAREDAELAYARALSDAQRRYRTAIDEALVEERAAERAAALAFSASHRLATASEAAAMAAAERALLSSIDAAGSARDILERYRADAARIRADAVRDERALFAELREQLQRVD